MGVKRGKKETMVRGESIVTIGTVDRTERKSMYMNVAFWVQPNEGLSYSKFNNSISKAMSKAIKSRFGGVNIIDVVCKESSFSPDKKSFVTISNIVFTKDEFNSVKNKLLSACDEFNDTIKQSDNPNMHISQEK